ncbi:MAG: iron export ABC transporter permease subunit FetB [Synechococcales bacterium]|nr:iron export ABC transporter permease subunit FetB [Synechococcales bacterium]
MEPLIELNDITRLGWAFGLMAIALGLTTWQNLGLTRNLAIATVRTTVQLLVVGYFLTLVFALESPWAVLAVLVVMLSVATAVARNRISKKLPQLLPWLGGTLALVTALTLGYVNLLVIRPDTWYEPQYVIPLAGILLGNAMNASAIAGERLVSLLTTSQLEIETHLSLGASPQQASLSYRREAVKAGMIPIINSMMVVGLVTLPGIITGQILSGVDPFNAALYQILIMFMLAFTDLVAILLVVGGILRQFFNSAAQLVLP